MTPIDPGPRQRRSHADIEAARPSVVNRDIGSVLVLGAGGFIGGALVDALADAKIDVLAYARSPATDHRDGVTFLQGSIEDTVSLRDAVAHAKVIVHVASVSTPGTSARDPSLEIIGNLLPLARVLECANEVAKRHVVYVSSGGAVYGEHATDAVEATLLRPLSYYGAGKVAAEAMLHACVATTDWTATVLRPTNPYGPGQPMSRGFAIVPTLFERARDGTAFQIWGDGLAVRDYLYIDDLIAALHATLTIEANTPFAVYNVASGETASVTELVTACEHASGRRIAVEFKPARGIDVAHVSPNADALTAATGWKPRVGLGDGLVRTWAWQQDARSALANR